MTAYAVDISGTVNSYVKGSGDVNSGDTTLTYTGSFRGAAASINVGDTLLLLQVQGADIDSTNTDTYGDGVGTGANISTVPSSSHGTSGYAGGLITQTAGTFEYVQVSSVSAPNITLTAGVQNDYSDTDEANWQIIVVPDYLAAGARLVGNVSGVPWDGDTGGVVAFSASGGEIDFNEFTVDASEIGFRGGVEGDTSSTTDNISDVVSTSSDAGGKGEGIAGTPRFVYDGSVEVDETTSTLPNGDYGRGAPGNAGGGAGPHNSGGGGGSNAGRGGTGAQGWVGGTPVQFAGYGGQSIFAGANLGGGGGSGDANNVHFTYGGVGGGLILLRADTGTGSGLLTVSGGDALDSQVGTAVSGDGAGGGGAAGTIFVYFDTPPSLPGLNVDASGGDGGDGDPEHGGGGGGGAGLVVVRATVGTVDVSGGAGGANEGVGGVSSEAGGDGVVGTGSNAYIRLNTDYGDSPDTYGTISGAAGAYHSFADYDFDGVIGSAEELYLGALIDGEAGGNPDTAAASDDTNNLDDEDGISSLDQIDPDSGSYSISAANIAITNSYATSATLHGWIDFDLNGTFDADEYASVSVASGLNNQNPAAGLTWSTTPGIESVTPGSTTYLRLRLTTDSGFTSASATGEAENGEVEDYAMTVFDAAPTPVNITRSNPTDSTTNADDVVFAISFSEDVQNVDTSDFSVSGAGSTGASITSISGSGDTYTVSVDVGDNEEGEVNLDVANTTGIQDLTGNDLSTVTPTGSEETYSLDNTAPTVAIQGAPANTNTPYSVTFEFSENVSGFVVGDIAVGNGSAGSFNTVDGNTYTAVITPAAAGTVTVDLSSAVASDAAGNGNTAATQAVTQFDVSAPTVAIQGVPASTNSSFTATFEFSENVSGFALGDISVGNGTASNFTTVDGNTYTALITPTAEGSVTIDVAGSVANDAAGNDNTAASQASSNFDASATSAPSVTIAEDSNNDGLIGSAELSGNIDVSVTVPADASAGDVLTVDDGNGNNQIITLGVADIGSSLDVSFVSPGDGGSLNVTANITDQASNISGNGTDSAVIDLTAPSAPIVEITEDGDNDGEISDLELSGDIDVSVTLPGDAVAGDQVILDFGSGTTNTTLSAQNIVDGAVSFALSGFGNGDTLTVESYIVDQAGNTGTTSAQDSALVNIDSDNDGLTNSQEQALGTNPNQADSDQDGIADAVEIDDVNAPLDSDGDGTIDALDRDDDNDGLPTLTENLGTDTDSDGTADYLDKDSDGDGIPDEYENGASGLDGDADGIDDAFDADLDGIPGTDNGFTDANGDGYIDDITLADTDGDGLLDFRDVDSDNDGLSDTVENGATGIDVDADGIDDGFDADLDGTPGTDVGFTDADGDGIIDDLPDLDADGDGVANYRDLDSDNDGLMDVNEAGVDDLNGDAIADGSVVVNTAIDIDGDSLPDYLDIDSDDDLFPDIYEAGLAELDQDSDGVIDVASDGDGDGIADVVDNSDQFGLEADTDGDGISNDLDDDDDNDGTPDTEEPGATPPLSGTDSDGDGIDDTIDVDQTGGPDTNNDGVDDSLDGDTDKDGIPNSEDPDSDNDGIPDLMETDPLLDSDGDGLVNGLDPDSDNDGISDGDEITGLPNLLDSDTDVDGIDDAIDLDSTSGPDTNNNGIDDRYEPSDTDGDGLVDHLDTDSDNDGILDLVEGIGDADNDGIPNFRDLDSDNDGIPDALEGGNLPTLTGSDADNDGIDDAFDVDVTGGDDSDSNGIDDRFDLLDSDSDGLPNVYDVDSDNDGIPDAVETFNLPTLTGTDADGDGIDDALDVDLTGGLDNNGDGADDLLGPLDTDLDGSPNYMDVDSDNDGIEDSIEADVTGLDTDADGIDDLFDVDQTGGVDSDGDGVDDNIVVTDTDNDSIADYLDLDSDNDTLADVIEAGLTDANLDGQSDNGVLATVQIDTDNDGQPDYRDIDSDNDGTSDLEQNGNVSLDANNDGQVDDATDSDGDGLPDSYDDAPNQFGQSIDSDGDGVANHLDLDDDNDGILDVIENSNRVLASGLDSNSNNIDDAWDVSLTGGQDLNLDGLDDVLYGDTDGDGQLDSLDGDSDNDGISDLLESGYSGITDFDDDATIDDFIDANADGLDDRIQTSFTPRNSDGSELPDFQDLDADNDGRLDLWESGISVTLDSDRDGRIDQILDADRDGVADSVDGEVNGLSFSIANPLDTDGDGIADYQDLDSDGDGFPDELENGDFDGDGVDDGLQNSGELETAVTGTGGALHWSAMLLLMVGLLFSRKSYRCAPLLAVIMLALSSSLARADSNSQYCGGPEYGSGEFAQCWYFSGGLGFTQVDPEGEVNGWSTSDDASEGWRIAVGRQFTPHWFAELNYTDAGEAGLSNRNPALDALIPDAAVSYKIPSLMAGYTVWENSKGFNLFGKAGIAAIRTAANDSRIGEKKQTNMQIVLALGASYRFATSPWMLGVEFDSYDKDAAGLFLTVSRYLGGKKQAIQQQTVQPKIEMQPIQQAIPMVTAPEEVETDTVVAEHDTEVPCPDGCGVFDGVMAGVTFESNKAVLTAEATEILDQAAQTLAQFPEVHIEIQAHTDNQGAEEYNRRLSQRRALAVKQYLVDKGVGEDRMTAKDTVSHYLLPTMTIMKVASEIGG